MRKNLKNRKIQNDRSVVVLIYDGVTLLDATGPAQVFASANAELPEAQARYKLVMASVNGGLVSTDSGIKLDTIALSKLSRTAIDTLLVAGGNGVFEATNNRILVSWLQRHMPRARRVGSTCMGAFLTARTGLLGTQRVTTHWRWCKRLQDLHPELDVVPEPIYIKNDNYASSAGVSAGIDLALAFVEDDHSRAVALQVAKALVLYLRRVGNQSQFSDLLESQSADTTDRFERLNAWIRKNLRHSLGVDTLAEQAAMSPRHFSRAYTAAMGVSPARSVERIRFETAKLLIETTNTPIKSISNRCGFNDYERMRRSFVKHIGASPNEYRQRFGRS